MQPRPATATRPANATMLLPPPPQSPPQPPPPQPPVLLMQPPPSMRADSHLTAASAGPQPLLLPPPPLQPTQPTQPTPAAAIVSEATKTHAPPPVLHEQRRSVFDMTNVARIMAHNLPTGVKISRDAKQCMRQIASEMTGFVTMEASAIAKVNAVNGVSAYT